VRERPLWTCTACGHAFANRNQSHSCGRFSVEAFLRGRSPGDVALFEAFRRGVQACDVGCQRLAEPGRSGERQPDATDGRVSCPICSDPRE
jgi:hypothetical protein